MNNERGFFDLNTLDLVKSCTTNLEYKTKQPTTTILAVGRQEVYSLHFQCLGGGQASRGFVIFILVCEF